MLVRTHVLSPELQLLRTVFGAPSFGQVKLPKAVKAWPVYALPSRDSQGRRAMKAGPHGTRWTAVVLGGPRMTCWWSGRGL